jgi:hypothetical protein
VPLMFAMIEGRPAFYCPACAALHRVPERLSVEGTDHAPSVVRDGEALFIAYTHSCRIQVKDGTLRYDPRCQHALRGAVRAMLPAPVVNPVAGQVRYSAMVAA